MYALHYFVAILNQQNKLALKLKQKREEKMQILNFKHQNEKEEHYTTVRFPLSGLPFLL